MKKLAQVRGQGLKSFGEAKHRFQLNPTLTEAEVAAFEQEHGIRLPEDYRAFLIHAGNGGAGPYYGIYPLSKWNYAFDWGKDDQPESYLARPCPLHPEWAGSDERIKKYEDAKPLYQGTLTLGTQGCSYDMLLIVTGEFAGRVVYIDWSGSTPYVLREPDFLSWYERWLDELLEGYTIHWFGFGPGGGEDKLLAILRDPEASDKLKSEAAGRMAALPTLSAEMLALLPDYLASPIEGVRTGILYAIHDHQIKGYVGHAARMLDDSSAAVRKQAIRTVMALDPKHYAAEVLRMLWSDPDKDVLSTALFTLDKAKAISKPDLIRVIEESAFGALRSSAAYKVEWEPQDLPLLVRMLGDEHAQVRHYAMLGLRKIKSRDVLPTIRERLANEQDLHTAESMIRMLGEMGDRDAVPVLIQMAQAQDDFLRVHAAEALAKIGDERAIPVIQPMLNETRRAERRSQSGGTSSGDSIGNLVRKSLRESPNEKLRKLA